MKIIHVERDGADRFTVCDIDIACQDDCWVIIGATDEPELVQQATCEQCLLRLFMLGDSAKIALARIGRVVQVMDAEDEAVVS